MNISHILCPIDFSEPSLKALDYAVDLAGRLGATLTIVHVYQLPLYAWPDGPVMTGTDFAAALSKQLEDQLDRAVARVRGRGVSVESKLVEGTPYKTIVELVEQPESDLIVMGTHGRTGLPHMLVGSVAERVVRTSPVPVLTLSSHATARMSPS